VAVLIQEASSGMSARTGESDVPIDEKVANAVYLEKAWLQSRGYDNRMLVAFKMIGDSMAPGLYSGDTLIINLTDKKPDDGGVFALNYEGTVLIRRLIRDAGHWWLSSKNADQRRFRRKKYAGAGCEIIGRVVYRLSERI
jgi:phage repressor protein C with HTH and peptisase S24 domain